MSVDRLNRAIARALEEYVEDTGEKMGDGDDLVAVFNDCALVISIENGCLKSKFVIGEPYRIDANVFDLGLMDLLNWGGNEE